MTRNTKQVSFDSAMISGEEYLKIGHSDELRPFFMSIVSDSNHWMFISSNGGVSAGRKNAQHAIFPYYTDDKITESFDLTGSKTIISVSNGSSKLIWEPFSNRQMGLFETTRNLYKNRYGNKIVFEEINHDLELIFRYKWSSSNIYGFVREATLVNNSGGNLDIEVLDGIQNIVPHGVGSDTQNRASNLVDAYKRSELVEDCGLGIYALSAIIVDKAEPSEALKANIVWSVGLPKATHLLSSLQLDAFRRGIPVQGETDIKGEKGAYFLNDGFDLTPSSMQQWVLVANVNQDHADIVALCERLKKGDGIKAEIEADIEAGTKNLIALNASSDAMQCTEDDLRDNRHFSNTLFNIMRGGIFDDNYTVERDDFEQYLMFANANVHQNNQRTLLGLPKLFTIEELRAHINAANDANLERLAIEYLPLKFSRRHGDPSRPWNIFSINTHSEVDGSKILDYEGNWRDIFQNWEALAYSFPEFIEGMILKFFNASTFDGYNPYRVTKGGFDWEIIEHDDPWSYIGYWGDHQIIYSLKFLEFIQKHYPDRLEGYFNRELFVYANVPYKIKNYDALLDNPKDTIDFDHKLDAQIRQKRDEIGADAALVLRSDGDIHQVNFIEKMLASVLAKISNFIPEGGIWMNTQRPEWNDANNALVGNGVSMVTLYYLRRYIKFFEGLFEGRNEQKFSISKELHECFHAVFKTLQDHEPILKDRIDDLSRRAVLDGLGRAGSDYRTKVYKSSFSGEKIGLSSKVLKQFFQLSLRYFDHSIRTNKRPDGLYHAYNLMTLDKTGGVSIGHLSEMLEGQVAVLSSGMLNGKKALEALDALKSSALFREDQYSYLLYPNKELPKFLVKNTVPIALVNSSALLSQLIDDGNVAIVERDVKGDVHFNGNFKNANDLNDALDALLASGTPVSEKERETVLNIFEAVFDHKSFTGRSGTFFGYEGLGSIYWHMVSKLLLAVQECCLSAIENQEDDVTIGKLLEHYYEINEGIGVHKSPELYGAFPVDPYSHTPAGKGAQQPGMTGQVKEDILSRFGELGVQIEKGQIVFRPSLLRREEFLKSPKKFQFVRLHSGADSLMLDSGSLAFTYCQLPIIYRLGSEMGIAVYHDDGSRTLIKGNALGKELSSSVFKRTSGVLKIEVTIDENNLK